MSTSEKIKIRRGNQEIGAWDEFEIRGYLSRGSLEVTDEFFDSETDSWRPLLPPYRRKYNFFDWAEEVDELWYFVKDGYIFGPRHICEIYALARAGYIEENTMISYMGGQDWITFKFHRENFGPKASALDHASEALENFWSGDTFEAGKSGLSALKELWNDFTAPEPITSEWLCIDSDLEEMPNHKEVLSAVQSAGFAVLNTEIVRIDGKQRLCLQFQNIEEATTVRDELEYESVGDWTFEFTNRT